MTGQEGVERRWSVGELARATGLTVHALHHYDEIGSAFHGGDTDAAYEGSKETLNQQPGWPAPGEGPDLVDYARPGPMTSAGGHAALLADLPHDLAGLAAVGHGVLIHEHVAPSYDVELSDADRATVHLRRVENLLGAITARDGRPLTEPREPKERTPGNCRHFTVLLVTTLRARGVPARARCGFGGYLGDGFWVDHWVAEVRHGDRWVLVDAQLDDVQRELFSIDFDVTDVPRDRFLVAGEAWRRCREGTADPNLFGLGETGLWWIAGNLVRDAASLLGVELLPWDCWGAIPGPTDEIGEDLARLFDRLAELTLDPDARADELRELCRDERLRVPSVVRNYLRQVDEPV